MSRIAQPTRKPSTGGAGSRSRISQSGIKPPSTSKIGKDEKSVAESAKTKKNQKPEKKAIEFQLPALSIVGKKREIKFEEIRKKVVRRGNPEGEDKKELAGILKHLRETKAKLKVYEFVSLIAKFTSDNGETLRKIMEDDLARFRKTVTKVYENMTQDVSDVLVNEQIQTANYYQEKYGMFNEKMLWMISEVFQMIPEFDFERYARDKEEYLYLVCPLPHVVVRDESSIEGQRRQEAFHRLQWLKIEGVRLSEENKRLEEKLKLLMEEHEKIQAMSVLKSKIMKERKETLELHEHERQTELHKLENELAKSAVRAEAYVRLEEDESSRLHRPAVVEKVPVKSKKKRPPSRPDWCSVTATDLEATSAREVIDGEMALADQRKRQRQKQKELTFGANTTMASRQGSEEYEGLQTVVQMQEKNIQQTTMMVQEKRKPPRRGSLPPPKPPCGGFC